jgi:hypothetical protein
METIEFYIGVKILIPHDFFRGIVETEAELRSIIGEPSE